MIQVDDNKWVNESLVLSVEPGSAGSLIYLGGRQVSSSWPPSRVAGVIETALVIERGLGK